MITVTTSTSLVSAARIFAYEFSNASESLQGFRTEFGNFSSEIFIVGVLTEKIYRSGRLSALRISDPTGVFTLSLNWKNSKVIEAADKIDSPSFVSVFGKVSFRKYAGRVYPEVIPETLSESSKDARNSWIYSAAYAALKRVEKMTCSQSKKNLIEKIEQAVLSAKPASRINILSDEKVLEIIEKLSEKKGAPVELVIKEMKKLGMTESDSVSIIERLLEDGDLYSPIKDSVKVL